MDLGADETRSRDTPHPLVGALRRSLRLSGVLVYAHGDSGPQTALQRHVYQHKHEGMVIHLARPAYDYGLLGLDMDDPLNESGWPTLLLDGNEEDW